MNHIEYPLTNMIHKEVLSLPISPVMKVEEVDYVIQKLNSWTY